MGKTALSAGANTFAFFTRNPRGGQAKPIDKSDADALNSFLKENSFAPLVVHAPYTLNACSDKDTVREFARNTFADDLERMEATPGQLYNFHPGSHMKQGIESGIKMISEMLNTIIKDSHEAVSYMILAAMMRSETGSFTTSSQTEHTTVSSVHSTG